MSYNTRQDLLQTHQSDGQMPGKTRQNQNCLALEEGFIIQILACWIQFALAELSLPYLAFCTWELLFDINFQGFFFFLISGKISSFFYRLVLKIQNIAKLV